MTFRDLGVLPITNGRAPKPEEGPRMVSVVLNFLAGETIELDFSEDAENATFTNCQSFMCDNRANMNPIVIEVVGTIVPYIVPAGAWIMGVIVVPVGVPRFRISCAGEKANVPIQFLNVPVPAITYTP